MIILKIKNKVHEILNHFYLRKLSAIYTKIIEYKVIRIPLHLQNHYKKKQVVISMTTFQERLPLVHLCIKTLLCQTVAPDKIVLYIGDDCNEPLPESLTNLEKFGLEIKTGYDDIKAHKKYLFAMQEYPQALIITADDDLLYPRNFTKSLLKSYEKHPNCISARRCHRITKNRGGVLPYNKWDFQFRGQKQPSHELFSTNGAGTLFPPDSLPKIAFDKELIKKLCLNADDIWLKFMLLLNGMPIVYVSSLNPMPFIIRDSQSVTLSSSNVSQNKNDEYIRELEKYFGINLSDFAHEIN